MNIYLENQKPGNMDLSPHKDVHGQRLTLTGKGTSGGVRECDAAIGDAPDVVAFVKHGWLQVRPVALTPAVMAPAAAPPAPVPVVVPEAPAVPVMDAAPPAPAPEAPAAEAPVEEPVEAPVAAEEPAAAPFSRSSKRRQ